MEINCSKTKKVVAYKKGKIRPTQTVKDSQQCYKSDIKLGKSQTNIHGRDISEPLMS